jgi:hypothetical protein
MSAKDDIIKHLSTNPNFDATLVTGVAMGQIPPATGPLSEDPAPGGAGGVDEAAPPKVAETLVDAGPIVPVVFVENVEDCELEALKQKIQAIAPGAILLRTGRFVALQTPPANTGDSIGPYAPSRYNIPPTCAGTLGARVVAQNVEYVLSSNHVLAHNGRAPLGTPVVVPGTLDDPTGQNVLGQLAYFVDMQPAVWPPWSATPTNKVDCAIASVAPASAVEARTSVNFFNGSPANGLAVSIDGRTTAVTSGRIWIWDCAAYIDFDFTTCFFDDMLATFGRRPFAAPGDSGALVLTNAGQLGLGLVTARNFSFDRFGNFTGYFVLMCKLESVAQGLANEMNVPAGDLNFFR